MSRYFICGFEVGSLGEFNSTTGTCSISSSTKRTGSYSFRANPTSGSGHGTLYSLRAAAASRADLIYSGGFALLVASLPNVDTVIYQDYTALGATIRTTITLKTTGALSISYVNGGTVVSSTNTLSADGKWHTIEFSKISLGAVYVDGVQWITHSDWPTTIADTVRIGANVNGGSAVTCDLYFDDLFGDTDQAMTAVNGIGNILILLATADPGALGSWTNGGGGTTSIFEGVNNRPPTGAAAATNGIKIKNAATGSNLDYVPTMQTYAAAGVPLGSKINAVMAICCDGEEVATGTKTGELWIASNPTQGAPGLSGRFDFGDDVGALGTFPTNWRTHFGPLSIDPSITLTTAPTLTVRKVGSTNRVVNVCFMGLYVDYRPPVPLACIDQPSFPHIQRAFPM